MQYWPCAQYLGSVYRCIVYQTAYKKKKDPSTRTNSQKRKKELSSLSSLTNVSLLFFKTNQTIKKIKLQKENYLVPYINCEFEGIHGNAKKKKPVQLFLDSLICQLPPITPRTKAPRKDSLNGYISCLYQLLH